MMAFSEFRSAAAMMPGRASMPPPPSRRERLAIVTSGSRLCGVGAYAAALRRQIGDSFDITVFELDQYLLRNPHRAVREEADRHIKGICRALRQFDAVNLQLEYGTLGRSASDIHRRFCWLTAAAPLLSVTFHTLLTPPGFPTGAVAGLLLRFRAADAARLVSEHRRGSLLSRGVARQLRRLQRTKPVSAIVHNRLDLCDARFLYGIKRVFDHPLAFLGANEVAAVRAGASRRRFPMLDRLPDGAALVGVFGFINEYKGFATAIEALHYLPERYHLLIFGGIHPQEIVPRQIRHPYISSLFDQAHMNRNLYQDMAGAGQGTRMVIDSEEMLRTLTEAHPRDLSGRIHFMGALDEADFLCGMASCDAVVFPYLEVGQSASGPISQALELGCRIIASRTRTFLEFARYHPDRIEFFDIGNHLELAARLGATRQFPPTSSLPEYNVATNKAIYLLANSRSAGISSCSAVPGSPAIPAPTARDRHLALRSDSG